MGNRFDSHQARNRRGALALTGALGFTLVAGWGAHASAQTYLCPPAPEGVFGLTGGPRFADTTPPDQFATQLDDPRWNGAWREDFSDTSSTEASARILMDDTYLYISLQAIVDPDGAQVVSDAVYLGFSQDQTTGIAVKILMDAASPTAGFTDDQTSVSTANWWKTTNAGATSWPKQGPQTWAAPPNVRLWTGPGTANGSAWAFNARLALTDLGAALGAPGGKLTGQFYMWYQIDIETPATTAHYGWPAGTTIGFDSATAPCGPTSMCAILPVSAFGIVDPTDTTKCPKGISIDPMSIGTTPLSAAGIPGTTIHYGAGHAGNQFVAVLTNTDPLNPPTANSVKARYRLSDWGSQIGGSDATWKDAATVGATTATAYGANDQAAGPLQVLMSCVNPPASGTNSCLQPTNANASTDQCLLVELSQNNGSGMRFVRDSARRNMDFVNASTFERSATLSVKGLAPLASSTGTRDAYIYVRTLNMPAATDGNHQAPIPPPVPPVTKGRDGNLAQPAEAVNQGPPRYRMTTYERVASVMPTYEVHVYHDTGKMVTEGGHTRHVVEPQAPFGYFVQHTGDLSGWRHALVGEGFVLEEISPNFYHAKIPDHGAVSVHTTINSCQKHLFGLINKCGNSIAGCGSCQCSIGDTGVPAAAPVCLLVAAIVTRRRRPRRR